MTINIDTKYPHSTLTPGSNKSTHKKGISGIVRRVANTIFKPEKKPNTEQEQTRHPAETSTLPHRIEKLFSGKSEQFSASKATGRGQRVAIEKNVITENQEQPVPERVKHICDLFEQSRLASKDKLKTWFRELYERAERYNLEHQQIEEILDAMEREVKKYIPLPADEQTARQSMERQRFRNDCGAGAKVVTLTAINE